MSVGSTLHRDLGLTDDEFDAIRDRLGRDPSYTELAMFSVMWSEHCSYKSSRSYLRTLPTKGPHVLVGPGEGAGVVEVAPGIAVAWKIESHNHPSYVEPFNGAATGVGGIVRDVLSMGARPIALLDPLRFGPLADAHTAYLVEGVVSGISGYGNSIGVPTVGGEVVFEECYAENPLVNVACLGVIEDRLMRGRADGAGNAVILFGSSTGRDGIGGASVLASAGFDDAAADKRPSVQVGDPFMEKLLIEASLELVGRDLLVGLQDLGAGGIACPASEMAAKSGTGMEIDLDAVHRREADMLPFEVMISESQERMMAVVEPARVGDVLEVCDRWGLTARVVGRVTASERIHVVCDGDVCVDAPAAALTDDAPEYARAAARPRWIDEVQAADPGGAPPRDLEDAFAAVLSSPAVASKRWVWEQYDHMIFLGTVGGPGGDAAVVRLPGSDVAVALATDGCGRFCYLDPYEGARLSVAEAARNVACTGARPLAVTNCLNFGDPEKPEVMWQFAEVVRGIGDACRALKTPVTGGNVSFYNETSGRAIYPTPVIGMLGVLDDAASAVGIAFRRAGDAVVIAGTTDPADVGGSEYAKVVNGTVAGRPPRLDLEAEARLCAFLVAAAAAGLVSSAHDTSEGGLAVALAECSVAAGIGCALDLGTGEPHRLMFAESPSRAVVTCPHHRVNDLLSLAADHGLPAVRAGTVGGARVDLGWVAPRVAELASMYHSAMEDALEATMTR